MSISGDKARKEFQRKAAELRIKQLQEKVLLEEERHKTLPERHKGAALRSKTRIQGQIRAVLRRESMRQRAQELREKEKERRLAEQIAKGPATKLTQREKRLHEFMIKEARDLTPEDLLPVFYHDRDPPTNWRVVLMEAMRTLALKTKVLGHAPVVRVSALGRSSTASYRVKSEGENADNGGTDDYGD
jgi:hypothetical protein